MEDIGLGSCSNYQATKYKDWQSTMLQPSYSNYLEMHMMKAFEQDVFIKHAMWLLRSYTRNRKLPIKQCSNNRITNAAIIELLKQQ